MASLLVAVSVTRAPFAALTASALVATPRLLKNTVSAYATKAEKKKGIDRKVGPKIDSTAESLANKGFLRPQKEYTPPDNLNDQLAKILQDQVGSIDDSHRLKDNSTRFQVFDACFKAFQHSIPNSLLHTVETIGDVKKFYATPVSTITPYDNLRNQDLPPNLHVQYEYKRFHPETDTMFNGVTAFPESSTIVTGLKYKGKYRELEQKPRDWLEGFQTDN